MMTMTMKRTRSLEEGAVPSLARRNKRGRRGGVLSRTGAAGKNTYKHTTQHGAYTLRPKMKSRGGQYTAANTEAMRVQFKHKDDKGFKSLGVKGSAKAAAQMAREHHAGLGESVERDNDTVSLMEVDGVEFHIKREHETNGEQVYSVRHPTEGIIGVLTKGNGTGSQVPWKAFKYDGGSGVPHTFLGAHYGPTGKQNALARIANTVKEVILDEFDDEMKKAGEKIKDKVHGVLKANPGVKFRGIEIAKKLKLSGNGSALPVHAALAQLHADGKVNKHIPADQDGGEPTRYSHKAESAEEAVLDEASKAGKEVWAHHPRGGVITGYASKRYHGLYGPELYKISRPTKEAAKAGNSFSVPAASKYFVGKPPAGSKEEAVLTEDQAKRSRDQHIRGSVATQVPDSRQGTSPAMRLARVAQHGTPEEKAAQVHAAVKKKFPDIEAIESPTMYGQGDDPDHAKHPMHAILSKHGWKYSHSTNMQSGTESAGHCPAHLWASRRPKTPCRHQRQ